MVSLHKIFLKQQSKFSPHIQSQIQRRIQMFITNPFDPSIHNHALHGSFEGYYSINISGDIRAIYKPKDNGDVVFIRIGTHSELYK
jgi:addiction module RelE/StbE family toxin